MASLVRTHLPPMSQPTVGRDAMGGLGRERERRRGISLKTGVALLPFHGGYREYSYVCVKCCCRPQGRMFVFAVLLSLCRTRQFVDRGAAWFPIRISQNSKQKKSPRQCF